MKTMSRCCQGTVTPELVEATSIREALSWVKREQQHNVVIKTDCLAVVKWIRSSFVTHSMKISRRV